MVAGETKSAGEPKRGASSTAPKKRKRVAVTKKKPPLVKRNTEAPSRALILDNGGDTIKYGWSTDKNPTGHLPNVTARLQQQWTVLVADQLDSIQNRNQLLGVTRSTERGMIVNLGNQVQVWKRLLDLMDISIPLTTEAAQAFGWKTARSKDLEGSTKIPSYTCVVLLALPPFTPRVLLDQMLSVWIKDFGFSRVGFCVAPACAAKLTDYRTSCVVDLGWSATHVVPVYEKTVLSQGIRRMPLAGRHLISMWKYYASYRQWNLMDQEWILRQVLEQTAYVSMQFVEDMSLAQRVPAGRRPYDREFVLPDFQRTFQGEVQLPPALQREIDDKEDEEGIEEDEDVDEQDMLIENDSDDGDESGEDTPEQARERLRKQREEEERRRREVDAEQQVLNVSVERFGVPEVLFRPGDAGLPLDWASLPVAIVQSIEACPAVYQPALYQSIRLVGGLSQLNNLRDRLELELRKLVPCAYTLRVEASEAPLDEAWRGARDVAVRSPYSKWSVGLDEWERSGSKGWAWKCLLASSGGELV